MLPSGSLDGKYLSIIGTKWVAENLKIVLLIMRCKGSIQQVADITMTSSTRITKACSSIFLPSIAFPAGSTVHTISGGKLKSAQSMGFDQLPET
jgi:hypothetical protein